MVQGLFKIYISRDSSPMTKEHIFTSESVSEGHPDKMSDQVSDAVLDAILAEDKHARVACETVFKTGLAMIAGEITTTAKPDYEKVISCLLYTSPSPRDS